MHLQYDRSGFESLSTLLFPLLDCDGDGVGYGDGDAADVDDGAAADDYDYDYICRLPTLLQS